MTNDPITVERNDDELVDPDPLSALLLALGAAGSVASLLAYFDQRSSKRRREREANEYAVRDAILGIETGLNELRGYIRSYEILFAAGATARGESPMSAPVRFGEVSVRFTRPGYERWQEVERSIADGEYNDRAKRQ